MDDSTIPAGLAVLAEEPAALVDRIVAAATEDLGALEQVVRDGVLAIGARVLSQGLAARGSGKAGAGVVCQCGGAAAFEGYRAKEVQTLVGWITVRRAYYRCPVCHRGHCPLDAALGLARDARSPAVRSLTEQFGARLPFAPAAALLADAAAIRVSPSTVRGTTEAAGARQETIVAAARRWGWTTGLPVAAEPPPDRLYVALDGVRILGTDGEGHEVKVGVVVPATQTAAGERRGVTSYAAGLESAAAFGQRLALEAHRRGAEGAGMIAVLGDGAAWIWNLAAEHFPTATWIVDWFHASERVWELARALHGEGTTAMAAWAEGQLERLAAGEAATLAREWQALPCRGETIAVRDAQVTYFTNQADRMHYAAYRAAGWDIGSGMVEGAGKHLIGARENGPGMRWSEHGAHTVAQVRDRLFNDADARAA